VLGVEDFGSQITLVLIDETKKSNKDYTKFDTETIEVPKKGAIIGKNLKHTLKMAHSNCSTTHATITPGFITDTSTYGTCYSLKTLDEHSNSKSQDGWKELESG